MSCLQRSEEVHTLVSRPSRCPNGDRYLLCVGYGNVTLTPPAPELLDGMDVLEIAFYHRQLRGNAASIEMAGLAATRGVKIVAMDVIADVADLPATGLVVNSAASIREQTPHADIRAHGRELQTSSRGVVVITDGDREVLAMNRRGVEYSFAQSHADRRHGRRRQLRAGMIYGLHQRWSLPDTLRWATAVGALQVQRSLEQDRPPSLATIRSLADQVEVRTQTR